MLAVEGGGQRLAASLLLDLYEMPDVAQEILGGGQSCGRQVLSLFHVTSTPLYPPSAVC